MKIKRISKDYMLVINIVLIILEFLTSIIAVSANDLTSLDDIVRNSTFKPNLFILPIIFSAICLIINFFFAEKNSKRIIIKIISFVVLISSIINLDVYSDTSPDDTMQLYGYEYNNAEYLNEIAETIDFDFPQEIIVLSWNPEAAALMINERINLINIKDRKYTSLLSQIYMANDSSLLENSVKENKNFLKKDDIPSEITVRLNKSYDYAVIYNKDLGTYNIVPDDNKRYNYLMVTYNLDSGEMYAIEYRK